MEISNLVDYELLHTLELRHPVTDAPLGITLQIRSEGSPAAKEVLRRHMARNLERRIKGKLQDFEQLGEQLEREELEKAASYIAAWQWGEHTYDGVRPELSLTSAVHILEREGWMYQQVVEAARKLENFSMSSPKVSVAM